MERLAHYRWCFYDKNGLMTESADLMNGLDKLSKLVVLRLFRAFNRDALEASGADSGRIDTKQMTCILQV